MKELIGKDVIEAIVIAVSLGSDIRSVRLKDYARPFVTN